MKAATNASLGLSVDLDRRARLPDAAFAHDHDQVGHRHRLPLVMGYDDRRDAEPALELSELDLHRLAQLRVERGKRLVEQEKPRRARKRAGNRHPLPLPAGQSRHRPIRQTRQAHQLEQLVDTRSLLALRYAADAQRIGDVLADRQMREESERLEHHAEVAPMHVEPADVGAVDQDASLRRLLQSGDHPKKRGLPAT